MTNTNTQGRILKGVGGVYSVLIPENIIVEATPRGILRKREVSPYPGDLVQISPSGDPDIPFCIEKIMPRLNFLSRPVVANIDLLLIVFSVEEPFPDYHFVEKMLILTAREGIDVSICVTKADIDNKSAQEAALIYEKAGYEVYIFGNAKEYKKATEKLKLKIKDKTIAFAGQSGVGKSTLFNEIVGHEYMDVGNISFKNKKGRHTTRHSEIIQYENGFIADTPGFSAIELNEIGVNGNEVEKAYPELEQLANKCKFSDCKHMREKGCAIETISMDKNRLERYRFFRNQVDSFNEYDTKKRSGG